MESDLLEASELQINSRAEPDEAATATTRAARALALSILGKLEQRQFAEQLHAAAAATDFHAQARCNRHCGDNNSCDIGDDDADDAPTQLADLLQRLHRADRTEDAATARREREVARASRADASRAASALIDRPPSRQRHAFPTHLIDTDAFLSQPPSARADSHGGVSNGASRSSRDKKVHSANATLPSETPPASERPPSRYMTKAKRNAAASVNGASKATVLRSPTATGHGSEVHSSSMRVLSRRCLHSVYSLNQVNHDPKTDGFADVDESVPPPFRIEITTDSYHATASHLEGPRISPDGEAQTYTHAARSSMPSRRWSSFGNQEQLLQHMASATGGTDDRRHNGDGLRIVGGAAAHHLSETKPLEWFGQDDQINNAHLFETVVSHPSASFDDEFEPACVADDDSSSSQSSSPVSASPDKDLVGLDAEAPPSSHGPSFHAMTRLHTTGVAGVPLGPQHISDQPWILASDNPFFYNAPPAHSVEFDDLDADTAIAQTPLYLAEDLMAIATEMSDLHLDDFIVGELQAMPLAVAVAPGRSGAAVAVGGGTS
ncbi:hypothetical protein PybrP1_005154 [[Pythium] brassicae (nom. inval.)]|nr:hypothetical protein PybrP1_005154 [[Pythium] brassicae (nom. inval.)]